MSPKLSSSVFADSSYCRASNKSYTGLLMASECSHLSLLPTVKDVLEERYVCFSATEISCTDDVKSVQNLIKSTWKLLTLGFNGLQAVANNGQEKW